MRLTTAGSMLVWALLIGWALLVLTKLAPNRGLQADRSTNVTPLELMTLIAVVLILIQAGRAATRREPRYPPELPPRGEPTREIRRDAPCHDTPHTQRNERRTP